MTAPAVVEAEFDPRIPGKVAYRITSLHSAAAVQHEISEILNGAGVVYGSFTNVARVRGVGIAAHFASLGYVVKENEVA